MKKNLSLAAVTLLLVVSSASDSRILLAQLIPASPITWSFSSGSVVGGNPLDTNVAVSSTHVCITTRAGFKCFTKDGTAVSPGIARCDTNGDPIRPVPFAAGAQLVSTFFSQSCKYVPPNSVKDGRIVFGSTQKRFFMVFQNRVGAHFTPNLLIAVSKSEDPRDGWWTYIDPVGGSDNSLDYQFLGVNSLILVVSNKMKLMDANNEMIQQWTDQTIYSAADLASGKASYAKKIWPPYNKSAVCAGCAEAPPFGPYSPAHPPPEKNASAPEFKAAACVHESPTTDFFWVHRDNDSQVTIFGRRGAGAVLDWQIHLQGVTGIVDGKQKDNNTGDGKPAPAISFGRGAGDNYQNCVVRNGKLVAVANVGYKWAGNPAGNVASNAIRLIRVDVSRYFELGPITLEIDRVFGKSSPDDPMGTLFDYGMPAVATNPLGDIVVGSIRAHETIYPEQRATVRRAGDSDIRPSISIRTGLDMAGGEYHMAGAAADPTTNAVYLAQEYPVSGSRRVWITKMLGTNRPDVIPLSISVPVTMARGTTYSGSVTIMNQGDAAMPAFASKVRLSSDDTINFLDLELDTSSNRALAPGETAVLPISITIPRTTGAGRYYVGAQVDSNGAGTEHSEINNANPFVKSGRGNVAITVQ